MGAGKETVGSAKRQREPLSDSEENIVSAPEMQDGLKRRRLEAAGQENHSPRPSTSGRLAEQLTKPDTPMIPSVRFRVQLLTQRGNGKDEFNQRMERFKAPLSTPSAAPIQSTVTACGSDSVSGIQQKLQCTTTPSSKQASLIRQEREMELNQLPFQPISKNAWLKKTSSDSSKIHQVRGDAEMKDGNFTETLASTAERPSVNVIGEGTSSETSIASAVFEFFNEGHEQKPHFGEEDEKECKSAPMNKEEQPSSQHLETQSVLELSFSEEHSLSELHQADEHRFLQSSLLDEANMKETSEVSKVTEMDICEGVTFGEGETMDNSSYGEELIEPSTDEELRIWRYPQSRAEESVIAEEKQVFTKEMEGISKSHRQDKEKEDSSTNYQKLTDIQDVGLSSSADVSSEIASFPKQQEGEKPEMGSNLDSVEGKFDLNSNKKKMESSEVCCEKMTTQNDTFQQSQESQSVCVKYKAQALGETWSGNTDHGRNAEYVDLTSGKSQTCGNGRAQSLTDIQVSDSHEMETNSIDGRQDVVDGLTAETHKTESSRKVTFILEPEVINSSTLTEGDASMESRTETSLSDAGLSSHDETNTSETIEKMFEEVLECAGEVEEKKQLDEETEDHDGGVGDCSGVEDKIEPDEEKKSENEDECDESRNLDGTRDELLTFPASGILSPLSKSVEAAITPLRLAATEKFDPPYFLLTQEDTSAPPAESAPLYSVDAYRTQRQSKLLAVQTITPAVQKQTPEMTKPQPSVNTKERIAALNEEASKLQTVINQTLQALSCCTDEEHGRGSLEEAEAEKLLLVSCEKRSALLAEVATLREERSSESEETTKEDMEYFSQQPCRGTVSITNIQLPLKVEFVCSSQNHTGRPTHYFFVLIRYGPCNIIATPLATAADAQNGDAISFPTSVTMKDIRSSFEIDVEVYSLSPTSGIRGTTDGASSKTRVTPRKLLNTITKSSNTLTCSASANARRSSNFCLVGSHKITLTSQGHNKFPLDKMKFEGKIRKLLGDEFQDKVPFLSPLEGNIYLKLDSEGHSDVQHQGFLTMFELISGFGVWNRQYFVLEGCSMYYWNHPNEKETKEAVGSISLSKFSNQCVRPVKREACARPFTFELVKKVPQLEDQNQKQLSKCWFSADTKQERLDWMEKLNQALLDFHTWKQPQPESQQPNTSSSGNLRESIL